MIDFLQSPSDRVSSFKVNVCVAQHIGDRQEQQDRVAIITSPRNPGAMLAIVADGMGGRTGGRMAADQVVSTAENLFKDMTERDSTFRDMLLHLAAEAHTVIRLTAISAEKEPHSHAVRPDHQEELRDLGACWRQPPVLLPRRYA